MFSLLNIIIAGLLQIVEVATGFFLFYSGFLSAYTKSSRKNNITILFYHEIGDRGLVGGTEVRPEIFKKQIGYISRWYNGVSLKELHDYLKGGVALPPNPVIITFDGGYKGNYTYAYPVLKKYNMPATIYLVTDYIQKNKLPWQFKLSYILKNTNKEIFKMSFSDHDVRYSLKNAGERTSCYYDIRGNPNDAEPHKRKRTIHDISKTLDVDLGMVPEDIFLTSNKKQVGRQPHSVTRIAISLKKQRHMSEKPFIVQQRQLFTD